MAWLQSNWIWLAAAIGFVAMHFFSHGGHRHGSANQEPGTWDKNGPKNLDDVAQDGAQVHAGHEVALAKSPSKQHRHGC